MMTKLRFIMAASILFIAVAVQAQHLKFMGIPLDGTIEEFEEKLIAKGCECVVDTALVSEDGNRFYEGKFAGEDARILISYDPDTEIVYQGFAQIPNLDEETAHNIFGKFKNLISFKYSRYCETLDDLNIEHGEFEYRWYIYNSETKSENSCGCIGMSVMDDYFPSTKTVGVLYLDRENHLLHESKVLNDL